MKALEDRIAWLEEVAAQRDDPLQVIISLVDPKKIRRDHLGNIVSGIDQAEPFKRYTAGKPDTVEYFHDGQWVSSWPFDQGSNSVDVAEME